MKKYVDTFLVIIGLLIIVGTVICYLFYNLNSTTMYAICGIVLVIMVVLLYLIKVLVEMMKLYLIKLKMNLIK